MQSLLSRCRLPGADALDQRRELPARMARGMWCDMRSAMVAVLSRSMLSTLTRSADGARSDSQTCVRDAHGSARFATRVEHFQHERPGRRTQGTVEREGCGPRGSHGRRRVAGTERRVLVRRQHAGQVLAETLRVKRMGTVHTAITGKDALAMGTQTAGGYALARARAAYQGRRKKVGAVPGRHASHQPGRRAR